MPATTTARPRTSKPRGICLYYSTPRGCFAGDKCKFLHGEESVLTPYDTAKRCRFYAQGFCKRGDACWFIHASDTLPDDDDDELCSICFEKPSTYGLLGGCSHIFCTTCIKQWRDPTNKPGGVLDSGNTKKCPMCRASCRFIIPSSRFWKEGTPEKERIVQAYKDSMARVPCRYFQKSIQKNKNKPLCPYGKDCFYQHLNDDGTPYIFKDGVDASMRKYRHAVPIGGGLSFSFDSDDIHFMPFTSFLDTMTFPLPSSRSPRERHVLDNFLRLQPRPGGSGTQPASTQTTEAQTQVSDRLREVSQTLDLLHDAIGENSSSLEHLSDAVEALRAGLGGLEAGATRLRPRRDGTEADFGGWFDAGWDDPAGEEITAEEEAARQEDVVMERLEDLADQMLASIDALRHESRGLSHAPSPDNDPDMPPLERIPHSDSDDSDDSDMPYLQSVSNTSSDDDDDDDMLDSEGLDSDGEIWPWQRQLLRLGSNTNNRRRQHQTLHRRGGGNSTNRGTRPAARVPSTSVGNNLSSSENANEDAVSHAGLPTSTTTETSSAPPVTSTSTPASPTTTTTETRSDPTWPGIFPCITITEDPTASPSSPSPPGKFEVVEAETSSSRTSTPSMVAEPPFVTDGRGRVVWTSSSDEVSPSSSAVETRSQSPIDGDLGAGLIGGGNGGTQSVASAEEGGVNGGRRSGGGGSTLFDWFSSLF